MSDRADSPKIAELASDRLPETISDKASKTISDRLPMPLESNPNYTPPKEPMTATQVVEYFKNVAPNPNTGTYESGFRAITSEGVPIFIFAPTRLAGKSVEQVQAEIDRVKRDYYEGDQGGGGEPLAESFRTEGTNKVLSEPPEGAKIAPGAEAPEGGGWYQGVGGYWHPTAMTPTEAKYQEPITSEDPYKKQQLALAEKMKPEFAALWREGVLSGDLSKYQAAAQAEIDRGGTQWSKPPLAKSNALEWDLKAWADGRGLSIDEARQRFIDYIANPNQFDNAMERVQGLREIAIYHRLYDTGQVPAITTSEKGEKTLGLLTREQVQVMSGLSGEALFNYQQALGILPSDYSYASGGEKSGILTGEQVDLLTLSAEERRAWEQKAKKEEPELYKTYLQTVMETGDYNKGIEAYKENYDRVTKERSSQQRSQKLEEWLQASGEERLRKMADPDSWMYDPTIPPGAVFAGRVDENGNPYYYTAEQYAKIKEQQSTLGALKLWMTKAQMGVGISNVRGKATTVPSWNLIPNLAGALREGAVTPQQLIDLGYDKDYVQSLAHYTQLGWLTRTPEGLLQPDLMMIVASSSRMIVASSSRREGQELVSTKARPVTWSVDSATRNRLIALGYSDKDINEASAYLEQVPEVYKQYIAQYGYDNFQKAAKEGNLPYSSSGLNLPPLKELSEDLQTFNSNILAKLNNSSFSTVEKVLGGIGHGALMLGPSLLVAGATAIAHPTKVPNLIVDMGKGIWQSLVTVANPQSSLPGEYGTALFNTALVLLQPVLGPGIRAVGFAETAIKPSYIPFRSMSKEAFTFRKMFTPAQIKAARDAGITETQISEAGGDLVLQLASGIKKASVKLGPLTVEVKNVPYQTAVPARMRIFNSTPDISLIDRGGSVPLFKDLYTNARAAVEPMTRSYLEGTRAVDPGVIEIYADPVVLAKYIEAQKILKGKIFGEPPVLEPQLILQSRDALEGTGFRLDPVPGRAGRGVTSDASLGTLKIRRFTLSEVTGNPSGLQETIPGQAGRGGLVVIPDLHAARNFASVFEAVNKRFSEPILEGTPGVPETWHVRLNSPNKGWTVAQAGDILGEAKDLGTYLKWRETFNRLHDEAKSLGVGNVERNLGNHELAILMKDQIAGQPFTDAERATLRPLLIEDIKAGRTKAAIAADGKLVTHAGVSLGVFPEFRGLTPEAIASRLNNSLLKAVKNNRYRAKDFAKGRTEKGHSLSKNERSQGGNYWLRPQEATPKQLDLGFEQIVGHNPGTGIRQIWNKNFIETDTGVKFGGEVQTYANTPFVETKPVPIKTTSLGGIVPKLGVAKLTELRLKAMRDTVADFILGWDGRIYAVESLKNNRVAMKALVKSLDEQIAQRKVAGDSVGVKFLQRQKSELTRPTGYDYLYGGIAFWRDIIMGRQNSMRILSEGLKPGNVAPATSLITSVRNSITSMSDYDVNRLFGVGRNVILDNLSTPKDVGLDSLESRLRSLVELVDEGVERNITPYLPGDEVSQAYVSRVESISPLDYNYGIPSGSRVPEMASEQVRTPTPVRTPETPSPPRVPSPAISEIRTPAPEVPRTPEVPGYIPTTPGYTPTPVPPPYPSIPTPTPVVPKPPGGPKIPRPLMPLIGGLTRENMRKGYFPNAVIVWVQGSLATKPVLKVIPSGTNQTKAITIRNPSQEIISGITELKPGKTLMMIEGDPVNGYRLITSPAERKLAFPEGMISGDLGVVDYEVDPYDLTINFYGKGTQTNVGTREESNVTGISLPGVSVGAAKSRGRFATVKGKRRKIQYTPSEIPGVGIRSVS